jgi:hypothetical protein
MATSPPPGLDAIIVAAAPVGTVGTTVAGCPHPPADPPFIAAGANAPASPATGATGSLVVAAAVGVPAGIVMGVDGP